MSENLLIRFSISIIVYFVFNYLISKNTNKEEKELSEASLPLLYKSKLSKLFSPFFDTHLFKYYANYLHALEDLQDKSAINKYWVSLHLYIPLLIVVKTYSFISAFILNGREALFINFTSLIFIVLTFYFNRKILKPLNIFTVENNDKNNKYILLSPFIIIVGINGWILHTFLYYIFIDKLEKKE